MAVISSAAFVDTAGTALEAHTPDLGDGFEQHPGYSGDLIVSPSGRCRNANSDRTHAVYRDLTALGSADYSVDGFFKRFSFDTHFNVGVVARLHATDSTYYVARFKAQDGELQLLKVVAGVETPLGTDFSTPFFLIDNWPD